MTPFCSLVGLEVQPDGLSAKWPFFFHCFLAESIIKLDFDSSDLPSPGTSSCAFEKSKSTQDQTKEYDMTCSPVDQSFNPDEVVILREEVI